MKKTSKKVIGLTASALIAVSLLAACGNSSSASKSDSKTISNLKISFIPSKNPDDITTATKPIANILKSELKKFESQMDFFVYFDNFILPLKEEGKKNTCRYMINNIKLYLNGEL